MNARHIREIKSRSWWIAGAILIPTAGLLFSSWLIAAGAADGARAANTVAARHEVSIDKLNEAQTTIREGVASIQSAQAAQSLTTERILDELRHINGR